VWDIIKLLAALAAIAAIVYGVNRAWTGFKDDIGRPYAEAQKAVDQPIVDKANKAQKSAEGERDQAQADTAACVASAAKQSDAVRGWQAQAELAEKRARDAEKAGRVVTEARAAEVHRYQVAAQQHEAAAQTCEQKLADIDAALRGEARARAAAKATGVPK